MDKSQTNKACDSDKRVDSSHYDKDAWSPLRITSLTQQIRELCVGGQGDILEIGVGKGLLKHFLSAFPGLKHTSLDIAEDLEPDVLGSVTDMPFSENQFDVTVCCQVLEHLPFQSAVVAMKEIRRVTRECVILSLPDQRRRLCFWAYLPKLHCVGFDFNYRPLGRLANKIDPYHQWEIGADGVSAKKLKQTILDSGFIIKRQYRLRDFPWHCFFILKPVEESL